MQLHCSAAHDLVITIQLHLMVYFTSLPVCSLNYKVL